MYIYVCVCIYVHVNAYLCIFNWKHNLMQCLLSHWNVAVFMVQGLFIF